VHRNLTLPLCSFHEKNQKGRLCEAHIGQIERTVGSNRSFYSYLGACAQKYNSIVLFPKRIKMRCFAKPTRSYLQTPRVRFAELWVGCFFLRSRTNAFASFLEKKSSIRQSTQTGLLVMRKTIPITIHLLDTFQAF
jgi:hypothetical protein